MALTNNVEKHTVNTKAFERLDLLLLTIEAIDLNHLNQTKELLDGSQIESNFPNQVELWKFRCHNHLRKSSISGSPSPAKLKSLITYISKLANKYYPSIRALLLAHSEIESQEISVFRNRFTELLEERFNRNRKVVKKYIGINNEELIQKLLMTLALTAGPLGEKRLSSTISENFTYPFNQ